MAIGFPPYGHELFVGTPSLSGQVQGVTMKTAQKNTDYTI